MSNNRELHKKIYLFHDILYTFSVFCSSDDELQKSYQRSSIPARPDAHRGFPEFFTLFQTPGAGIEPATNRLTGDCSTAELSRNKLLKLQTDFNPYLSRLQPKIILNFDGYRISSGISSGLSKLCVSIPTDFPVMRKMSLSILFNSL